MESLTQKHLEIIESVKRNPPLLVLAALLSSEIDLDRNWAGFAEDARRRIAWFVMGLNDSNFHNGDCVNRPCPCILCDSIECIDEANEWVKKIAEHFCVEDDVLSILTIDVVLGTESADVIFEDIQTRIKFYSNASQEKTTNTLELISFARRMLSTKQEVLKDWWKGSKDESFLYEEQ